MTQGKIYVGRAKALHVAGVGHLPELGTRHHPREMDAIVATWLARGGERVVYNPYTLDPVPHSAANRVMAVALDPEGCVVVRPFSKHPQFDYYVASGTMLLGEFWGSVGEDWVLAV